MDHLGSMLMRDGGTWVRSVRGQAT